MTTVEHRPEYRALNDSLTGFSKELNDAESLSDIQVLLQSNLKQLFSCCVCRITYFQQSNFVCFTVTNDRPAVVTGTYQLLWDVEKLLFYEGLPLQLNANEHSAIFRNIPYKSRFNKLWGWKLSYTEDSGILLNILADEQNVFSRKFVPLVKMICEMLFTKIRLILLLQTMQKREADLISTNEQLEESHAIICKLAGAQEDIIEERTQQLTKLNKQLIDLIQFNSHVVREPLTRVMGLLQLKQLVSDEDFYKICWPMIIASVNDLDDHLREIIIKAEKI